MHIINQCELLINELWDKEVKGIGIASSGVIDSENGIILSSGSIPNWSNIEIKKIFENKFNVPVSIDNDVNVSALGEYTFGAGKKYSSIILFTVSTGIGFASIINGKIHKGVNSLAGQIAHIYINDGLQTINDIMSGKGIATKASKLLQRDISTNDVFVLSNEGNAICSKIIMEAEQLASTIIAVLYNTIDPNILLFSGSVALKQKEFISRIHKRTNEYLRKYSQQRFGNVKFDIASLGDDTGILGGVSLIKTDINEKKFT